MIERVLATVDVGDKKMASSGRPGGIPTPASRRKSGAANVIADREPPESPSMPSPADSDFKVPTVGMSASRKASAAHLRPASRPKTPSALSSSGASATYAARGVPSREDPFGSEGLSLGDTVSVLGQEGILRYYGGIQGKNGTYGGVELIGEFRGQGKNNGCVNDTRYFDCEPECGIFVMANKIMPAFTAPEPPLSASSSSAAAAEHQTPNTRRINASAEASHAAQARIQPGSRASKYVNMTASQLHRSPRKQQSEQELHDAATAAAAEEPPSTPVRLSSSASSSTRTSPERPTPRAAKPRQSLGLTPTGGRKSIGGSSAASSTSGTAGNSGLPAPRSAIRRPSSRAGTSSAASTVPDVPPVPLSFGSASTGRRTPSISSASASGRATPNNETPSKHAHRASYMDSLGSPTSRSTTPSRSVSRQSAASERRRSGAHSISGRPSSRASIFDRSASRAGAHADDMADEVARLQGELSSALKTIEEQRQHYSDNEKSLKASQARFEEVSRRLDVSESELKSALSKAKQQEQEFQDERNQPNTEAIRLQAEVDQLRSEVSEASEAAEQAKSALTQHQTSMEAEQKERAIREAEEAREKEALQAEIEKFRVAGLEVFDIHKGQLRDAEEAKISLRHALETTEEEVTILRQRAREKEEEEQNRIQPPLPPGSAPATSPAALAIDNESLRADNQHLRKRLNSVEDHLEDVKVSLERESERAQEKQQQSSALETRLRQEIQDLRLAVEKAKATETELNKQVAQLDTDLRETRSALENARGDLESARVEVAPASDEEKVAQLQRELSSAQEEAAEARKQAKSLEEEIALLEEIKTDTMAGPASSNEEVTRLQAEVKTREEEVERLQTQLASGNVDYRRESTGNLSISSARAGSSSPSSIKDREDAASLKEQVVGLKVIVSQLTEENQELVEKARSGQDGDSSRRQSQGDPGTPTSRGDNAQKLADLERRKNKEIKSLNHEISELERLIESKIFREDELESAVNRYRDMLAKANVPGFSNTKSKSPPSRSTHMSNGTARSGELEDEEEACELCGDKTHDLLKCPLMNDEPSGQAWCDNCEKYGHATQSCQSADEVF